MFIVTIYIESIACYEEGSDVMQLMGQIMEINLLTKT